MVIIKLLIIVAAACLVSGNEAEDVEQKKRGAGKPTSLNAIPSGAQKNDYTYSIYSQNPNVPNANTPQAAYQNQITNSFYPTQSGGSPYYQSSHSVLDAQSGYPPQPQLNLLPPPSSSQFVPLNFIPTPGYQSKYQLIPQKYSSGQLQLAILSPSSLLNSSPYGYQTPILGGGQQPYNPHQQFVNPLPQGQFTPNYQHVPINQPYLGQQSSMLLVAQASPSGYPNVQNFLYPNTAVPNLYNYYQQPAPQVKYNLVYGTTPQQPTLQQGTADYEKGPTQAKEDNEISVHSNDYLSPAESNTNYKNTYASSRPYKN